MEMNNFQGNICYNTLIDQVSTLCSELLKHECKISFCVKLEHFQFSLPMRLIKFILRKGSFKSHLSQLDGQEDEQDEDEQDDGKLGLQLSALTGAKPESASEPVNSLLNVDSAGQTHNNEGEWTVVYKRRKSLKAHRPYPAGRYATPHPSDVKSKIGSFDVFTPADTSTAEIKRKGFVLSSLGNWLPTPGHLWTTESRSQWVFFP